MTCRVIAVAALLAMVASLGGCWKSTGMAPNRTELVWTAPGGANAHAALATAPDGRVFVLVGTRGQVTATVLAGTELDELGPGGTVSCPGGMVQPTMILDGAGKLHAAWTDAAGQKGWYAAGVLGGGGGSARRGAEWTGRGEPPAGLLAESFCYADAGLLKNVTGVGRADLAVGGSEVRVTAAGAMDDKDGRVMVVRWAGPGQKADGAGMAGPVAPRIGYDGKSFVLLVTAGRASWQVTDWSQEFGGDLGLDALRLAVRRGEADIAFGPSGEMAAAGYLLGEDGRVGVWAAHSKPGTELSLRVWRNFAAGRGTQSMPAPAVIVDAESGVMTVLAHSPADGKAHYTTHDPNTGLWETWQPVDADLSGPVGSASCSPTLADLPGEGVLACIPVGSKVALVRMAASRRGELRGSRATRNK